MKKENWALGLGIVSIVISVTTLSLCKMDIKPYSSDGASLSIAVLTLVVTVYMAIQIYNAFILKGEIKESIRKDIEESSNNILYHSMYLTFFFQGVNELRKTHSDAALYYLFKSMECLTKTNIDKDKMNEIIMKIRETHKNYPITLSKNEVFEYKRITLLADIKEKDEVMSILDGMEAKG